jgi:hypothetical protein
MNAEHIASLILLVLYFACPVLTSSPFHVPVEAKKTDAGPINPEIPKPPKPEDDGFEVVEKHDNQASSPTKCIVTQKWIDECEKLTNKLVHTISNATVDQVIKLADLTTNADCNVPYDLIQNTNITPKCCETNPTYFIANISSPLTLEFHTYTYHDKHIQYSYETNKQRGYKYIYQQVGNDVQVTCMYYGGLQTMIDKKVIAGCMNAIETGIQRHA